MPSPDEMLTQHLAVVPAFRALIRTQEQRLFNQEPLAHPVLDIGCGDGYFATVVFPGGLDATIDISWPIVAEGKAHGPYRHAEVADGTRLPYCDASFNTVVSNCVMEHIPDLEALVDEVSRVLRPGGRFIFSVCNDRFTGMLFTVHYLNRLGLRGLAERYGRWWNRRAVHHNLNSPRTWEARLERHGMALDRHTYYMSAAAMQVFEVAHYYSAPSILWHRLLGRWSLLPGNVRHSAGFHLLRRYAGEPEPPVGACSFLVAHRRTDR